jgi:hypothetical protein
MQRKLIRRAAMFITSVLAMTVLFAVPVFAGSKTFKDVPVKGIGKCDVTIDFPETMSLDTSISYIADRKEDDDGVLQPVYDSIEKSINVTGMKVTGVNGLYSEHGRRNSILFDFQLECDDAVGQKVVDTFKDNVATGVNYEDSIHLEALNPEISYQVSNLSGSVPSGIASTFEGKLAFVGVNFIYKADTTDDSARKIEFVEWGQRNATGSRLFSKNINDDASKNINDDADDDDDDDDDSGMSWEERQQEMARNFAPNASTLTPEQSAGWSLVSREAPAISSGAGVAATSAYQGPVCRLAFQLAAPGYSIGHTYNMTFRSAGGTASMRVPSDLVKSGRRFALAFVTSDGRYVSTPAITADASGYLNFNLTGLGLAANSNNAVAIMYLD